MTLAEIRGKLEQQRIQRLKKLWNNFPRECF